MTASDVNVDWDTILYEHGAGFYTPSMKARKQKTMPVTVSQRLASDAFRLMPYFLLCVVIAVIFTRYVPINMDEFVHYHALICHFYFLNELNTYREACGMYDLNVWNTGIILPLRVFGYSGSFPSLYYFPFFLLWRDVESARLMGLLFLLAQAGCVAAIFRWRLWIVFGALLLFFPYAFQHIVDTGPIAYHTTSVFLFYEVFRRWCRTLHARYAVITAVLVFFGIWTKLVFAWLVPGIGLIFALCAFDNRKLLLRRKKFLQMGRQIILSVLLILMLCSTLFLSTNPVNSSEFPYLRAALDSEQLTWTELKDQFWDLLVTQRASSPLEATHRVYNSEELEGKLAWHSSIYAAMIFYIPLFALPVLLLLSSSRVKAVRSLFFYALFILTFLLIARTRASHAMHHAVLAFPFLILCHAWLVAAMLDIKRRKRLLRPVVVVASFFAVVYMLQGVFWYAVSFTQTPRTHDHPSKNVVHRILYDPVPASRYIYVITDWGMYYYQGLFGDRAQSVIYLQPVNDASQIDELLALAERHGRKLLFVYSSKETADDLALIRDKTQSRECMAISPESVWRILAQDVEEIPGCAIPSDHAPDAAVMY